MRHDNKALLIAVLAFVVWATAGGAFFFLMAPSTVLPIPAGKVISEAGFNTTFSVSGGPARLVGAWYANHGGLIWIYPSDSPPGLMFLPCIRFAPWNGTADVSLAPGTYTMAFYPGGTFVVTREIHLDYPGDLPATNRTLFASWCNLQ